MTILARWKGNIDQLSCCLQYRDHQDILQSVSYLITEILVISYLHYLNTFLLIFVLHNWFISCLVSYSSAVSYHAHQLSPIMLISCLMSCPSVVSYHAQCSSVVSYHAHQLSPIMLISCLIGTPTGSRTTQSRTTQSRTTQPRTTQSRTTFPRMRHNLERHYLECDISSKGDFY